MDPHSRYQVTGNQNPGGLYVHIPFCLKKCPYCDFFSISDLSLVDDFIQGLITEMRLAQKRWSAFVFDTLYMGGGTPSVLTAPQIGRIIDGIHRFFTFAPDAEITLEMNPGTTGVERMKDYLSAGINRLNIGVQSFSDRQLSILGRIHSGTASRQTLAAAQTVGFDHLGIDLIYGIPGQEESAWTRDLQQSLEYEPDHMSCYQLTLEPHTPMAKEIEAGRLKALPEGPVAALFKATQSFLSSRRYIQYEISNFACCASAKSRHNQKYWSGAPYLGLGPSAHSFQPPDRWWNHRGVPGYLRDIQNGELPVAGKERLEREQRMMESVYLGLRTAEGIDILAFNGAFNVDFYDRFAEPLARLEGEGLLLSETDRCILTTRGMRFHESVVGVLIDWI